MTHLTKSLFTIGCQCPKYLWWKVHEPLAEELQPDKVLLDRFDQGRLVGELARQRFPGGVLIPYQQSREGRCEATRASCVGNGDNFSFVGRRMADSTQA